MVLDIVAQSARALDVAHRSGIVHRDIKPGNLLIMADGTTKITDFGIAKAKMQDVNLTATGLVMGTALYVSPEQATGQPVTGSSDVYSLGVVAYECLAGDPPFVAEQPVAIAIMHKQDPVPPLPADVPRPVADLVYAMLAQGARGPPGVGPARRRPRRGDPRGTQPRRLQQPRSPPTCRWCPTSRPPPASTFIKPPPERQPAPRGPGTRASWSRASARRPSAPSRSSRC